MTFLDAQAPIRLVWPAIIAGIALMIAGATSVGGINIMGAHLGFGFVPLLVLTIWPRQANTLLSILLIFVAGIFTDWATGGIVGQWALVYCLVWGLLRPELRDTSFASFRLLLSWAAACGLAAIIISLSGWFVFGLWPAYSSFVRQAALATLILPLVVILRSLVSRRFFDGEEWDR